MYPRSVLLRNRALAAEMVAAMGDRPVVVLRGHGLTATGASVPEAVLRARSVDTLAGLDARVAGAGGLPVDLPPEDLAELRPRWRLHPRHRLAPRGGEPVGQPSRGAEDGATGGRVSTWAA